MKIAFCLPDIDWLKQISLGRPTDAAVIQQNYIFEGLASRKHQLTLFAPQNLNNIVSCKTTGEVYTLPRTWSAAFFYQLFRKGTWTLQRLFKIPYLNYFSNFNYYDAYLHCLRGYDIVYERVNLWSSGAAMASNHLNIPFVLFFDADQILEADYTGEELTGLMRQRACQILRYNLKTAKALICVSEQAKTNLVKNWQVPAEKIVVLKNGVDVQHFRPLPEARKEVRTDLGIPADSPVMMFVGSFYQWHDVGTLLTAFSQVLSLHPQAHLVLVGDGTNRQAMMQKAESLGISHAVHFTGLVPHADVPRWIAAADIGVVPYPRMEQGLWLSPMKLFEFMASGLAIVASDLGQVAEVIQNEENGLLVPPGDAEKMAAAMSRLIDDETLQAHLAKNARMCAEAEYSWENYFIRLESLFCSLTGEQPK